MTDPRVAVTAAGTTPTVLAVQAEDSPTRTSTDRVQQVVLVEVAVELVVLHQEEEGDGKLVARRPTIKMLPGIGGKWK